MTCQLPLMDPSIIVWGVPAGQLVVELAAAIVGPLLAILAAQHLAKRQRDREGKIAVLKALLTSQRQVIEPQYSEAINIARLEFENHPAVIEALDRYIEASNDDPSDPSINL